jgi:hypothetical protein
MKNRDHKLPKSDELVSKTQKSSESEKAYLTTIKMDPHSPVQDFVCRDEHQKLFESLWKKGSGV